MSEVQIGKIEFHDDGRIPDSLLTANLENTPDNLPTQNDPVNHPAHYTDGKIEVIDFIEDKNLGFHLGNVVKYVCRAGKKDPDKEIEDLRKAAFDLNRKIVQLREQQDGKG